MVDTPGILLPNVGSVEMGLNLALTGAVRDEVVGHETLALYLLDLILQSNEIKSLFKIYKSLDGIHVESPVELLDHIMSHRGHQNLRDESKSMFNYKIWYRNDSTPSDDNTDTHTIILKEEGWYDYLWSKTPSCNIL